MAIEEKRILMLARRDPREALRVTAGLAVRGHDLEFFFLKKPTPDENGRIVNLEMLEVMEIEPFTLLPDMDDIATQKTANDLRAAIARADHVLSI
jgi:hypothetical protein